MNRLIAAAAFIIPLGISLWLFPEGAVAYLISIPFVITTIIFLKRSKTDSNFLIQLFVAAFLVRTVVAALIFGYDLQPFFGPDSIAHEAHGFITLQVWEGIVERPEFLDGWNKPWGLHTLIATVYSLVGRNPLAISFLSAFCGALTSVLIYLCAMKSFRNVRVAATASILTAFFPGMIIWSSQIMKDGFVVFFVVLAIYFLTKLQDEFSWKDLILLLLSLVGIYSIRYYIFYFAAFACAGSFVFGGKDIVANNVRGLLIMSVLALIMAYTGVLTIGTEQVERLSNLETLQYSRNVLSIEAESGYSAETDIRTTSGALTAFPVGLVNLLFAPFPWQFSSLRSALPLPEMIVWWALIPSLILGLRYTLKHRFREAVPMVLFTITLTIAYALFQTNVGTAYRQRTQIQVFLFVFVGVGWTIFRERRQDRKLIRARQTTRVARRGMVGIDSETAH